MARTGAMRTVRNGEVVIGGVRFRPSAQYRAYDGRCDGQRFLFGRYVKPGHPGEYEPFVGLCMSEAELRGAPGPGPGPGPEVVDGSLPWMFWHAVPS